MTLKLETSKIGMGLSFCALLCFAAFPLLASPDEEYERANHDFRKDEFVKASEKYEALVEKGHFSKNLFFNLGTALYRSGAPGESMLWFRRAQLLDPGMAEVRQNMEFLRSKLGFLEFSPSKKDRILLATSPALLRWLSALGLWFIAFAVISLLFIRRFDRFRPLIISASVFAFIISGSSIWLANYRSENLAMENFATITSADAKAFTAPVPSSKSIIDLPPGSEVKVLQNSDRWTYVAIPGDLRGWVRSDNLKAIWPIPVSSTISSK